MIFFFGIFVEPIITKATNGKVDLIDESNKKFFYMLPLVALLLIFNPFDTNDSGYRTHVQTFPEKNLYDLTQAFILRDLEVS